MSCSSALSRPDPDNAGCQGPSERPNITHSPWNCGRVRVKTRDTPDRGGRLRRQVEAPGSFRIQLVRRMVVTTSNASAAIQRVSEQGSPNQGKHRLKESQATWRDKKSASG